MVMPAGLVHYLRQRGRSPEIDRFSNIVLAGRMISADRAAFGAIRVMVNLNQTGEASGVTASLAATGAMPVYQVEAEAVRKNLSKLGAIVI